MFCYIWEFLVRAESIDDFRAAYGPEGDWVMLFRQDPQYIRTELLADREDPKRFLTIDYWTSHEACISFRERFRSEFDALDKRCEDLTTKETHLGDFQK